VLWVITLLVVAKSGMKAIAMRLLLPYGIMVGALTAWLYTPVIIASGGMAGIVSNAIVSGLSRAAFLDRLPSHLLATLGDYSRDVPVIIRVGMLCLLVAGLVESIRLRRWGAASMLPAIALGVSIPLFLQHQIPFARTWIFILPFLFVLMDAGCGGLRRVVPAAYHAPAAVAMVVLAGLGAVALMNHDVISRYDDTGAFPEAQSVVQVLAKEMASGDSLAIAVPAEEPVLFYMWHDGVPSRMARSGSSRREFLVVKKSRYSLEDLTTATATMLVTMGDAEVYVRDLPAK
jgi:hypothetical protein